MDWTPFLVESGISPDVLALLSAAVARENTLLPIWATQGCVGILFGEPPDEKLLTGLAFILRRDVVPMHAKKEVVCSAIDHYYVHSVDTEVRGLIASKTDWKLRCDGSL